MSDSKIREQIDELSQATKKELTFELSAFIKSEMETVRELIKQVHALSEEKLKIQTQRIEMLDQLIVEHREECAKKEKDTKEVLEALQAIKAGMKFTNFMRNMVISFAGLVTSIWGLAQLVKDHVKW